MSSKPAAVELDLLGLDRDNTINPPASLTSSKSQLRRLYDRQRSFREVQNAITKINPELLKASMAGLNHHNNSGNCNGAAIGSKRSISVPSAPAKPEATPLTIFYNGTVSVFDLTQDKAETILKLVNDGCRFKKPPDIEEPKLSTTGSSHDNNWMTHYLSKRRMLHRNVSLQRFLEKRQERLTAMPVDNNGDINQKKKDNDISD